MRIDPRGVQTRFRKASMSSLYLIGSLSFKSLVLAVANIAAFCRRKITVLFFSKPSGGTPLVPVKKTRTSPTEHPVVPSIYVVKKEIVIVTVLNSRTKYCNLLNLHTHPRSQ